VDNLEIDWEVLATANLGEEEFVHGEIGVGEIELDLEGNF
jgi:hypothetical protein